METEKHHQQPQVFTAHPPHPTPQIQPYWQSYIGGRLNVISSGYQRLTLCVENECAQLQRCYTHWSKHSPY